MLIFAPFLYLKTDKKKIMSVEIRLEQSKFKDKKGAGKWYARTVSTGVVTTDDLADSIQENTSFSRGDVRGLVIALIDEISYRLRQGETVALEGLGRFHLTVEPFCTDQYTQCPHGKEEPDPCLRCSCGVGRARI